MNSYVMRQLKTPRRPARSGLTLIELLVAVGLLSIMILCFGKIIAESRKVVTVSEATMRSNNMAIAMEQTLREDIDRTSRNGFLCIGVRNGSPVLICSTAGPGESMTGVQQGTQVASNCKIVMYGLTANPGVLYKTGWLMSKDNINSDFDPEKDLWGTNVPGPYGAPVLADIQTLSKTDIHNSFIGRALGAAPTSLTIPPESPTDILQAWKYVATNCSNLGIYWTDGSKRIVDGNVVGLNWYGCYATAAGTWDVKPRSDGNNSRPLWSNRTVPGPAFDDCEYKVGGNDYFVMWNKDDEANWPLAIKINFTIADPAMPQQFSGGGTQYEIVCPLGR